MIAITDTKVTSAISGKRKNVYTIKPSISASQRTRIQQRRYTMSISVALIEELKIWNITYRLLLPKRSQRQDLFRVASTRHLIDLSLDSS
jgi:uncharacterized protein YbaP (TraB family)